MDRRSNTRYQQFGIKTKSSKSETIHEAKFAEGIPEEKTGALWTEERKRKFSG